MEFACWNSSQLDAYAAATGRTSLSVAAAVLTAAHNYSMPAIAQQMAFRFGVTRTARQWRNIIHQCISQQPQFISPDLRFRASNRVVDERVPVALRQMVDSFPVRIPRPNTQRMRQAFYSVPHHEVCVKFNVAITHEELCTMVGEEFRGAGNDKTDWHTAAHSVQHYVMDDLILADTAYSGAAHVVCKVETPITNREHHWNCIMGILRTPMERYFGWLHNNFEMFHETRSAVRGESSPLVCFLRLVIDIRNFGPEPPILYLF